MHFKKFLSIKNYNMDISIGKIYNKYSKEDIQDINQIWIKYKHSTIEWKDIPTGGFNKITLKHSFLNISNEYSVLWRMKRFFNFNFLPKFTNLEVEGLMSYSINPYQIIKNLRGFWNVDYFSPHEQSFWQQYLSFKLNFFNSLYLERKKMSFFLYISE